jgi:hypothetical protein
MAMEKLVAKRITRLTAMAKFEPAEVRGTPSLAQNFRLWIISSSRSFFRVDASPQPAGDAAGELNAPATVLTARGRPVAKGAVLTRCLILMDMGSMETNSMSMLPDLGNIPERLSDWIENIIGALS